MFLSGKKWSKNCEGSLLILETQYHKGFAREKKYKT
jgi:hypothetical protein